MSRCKSGRKSGNEPLQHIQHEYPLLQQPVHSCWKSMERVGVWHHESPNADTKQRHHRRRRLAERKGKIQNWIDCIGHAYSSGLLLCQESSVTPCSGTSCATRCQKSDGPSWQSRKRSEIRTAYLFPHRPGLTWTMSPPLPSLGRPEDLCTMTFFKMTTRHQR